MIMNNNAEGRNTSAYKLANKYSDDLKTRAHGNWPAILSAAGIDQKFLENRHGPCPICGGRDRFRFDDKNGTGSFFCSHCGAGDGIKLLCSYLQLSFVDALNWLSHFIDGGCVDFSKKISVVDLNHQTANAARKAIRLTEVWNESRQVATGDPVSKYLMSRGLILSEIPSAIRCHHGLWYRMDEEERFVGPFPTMLVQLTAPSGEVATLHRTYLTQDGCKAPVPKVKRLMSPAVSGACSGASIRLFPAEATLGIAEGIETALACHIETGLPTWAAGNAGLLKAVVMPETVEKVVIFADNDINGVGQTKAKELEQRLLSEGRQVKLLIPPKSDSDWLDQINGGRHAR